MSTLDTMVAMGTINNVMEDDMKNLINNLIRDLRLRMIV